MLFASMIGSYRSSNLDASFDLFLGILIWTCVFRLDQEVAFVSMYLRLIGGRNY